MVLLVAWTAEYPRTGETSVSFPTPNGRAGWYGMQIQVWDPDNETEILDMPYSDPVAPTTFHISSPKSALMNSSYLPQLR
jgi:hypothetical protein